MELDNLRFAANEVATAALEHDYKGMATAFSHVSMVLMYVGTAQSAQARAYVKGPGVHLPNAFRYGSPLRAALEKFNLAVLAYEP